jgi:hypothetical protein
VIFVPFCGKVIFQLLCILLWFDSEAGRLAIPAQEQATKECKAWRRDSAVATLPTKSPFFFCWRLAAEKNR